MSQKKTCGLVSVQGGRLIQLKILKKDKHWTAIGWPHSLNRGDRLIQATNTAFVSVKTRDFENWPLLYLRLRLARHVCICVELRWLAPLTLVEIKFARKLTQVFHRLATQPKSTRVTSIPCYDNLLVHEVQDMSAWNVFLFLATSVYCEETCESVWPPNVSIRFLTWFLFYYRNSFSWFRRGGCRTRMRQTTAGQGIRGKRHVPHIQLRRRGCCLWRV